MHSPTAGSWEGAVFDERGTSVRQPHPFLCTLDGDTGLDTPAGAQELQGLLEIKDTHRP